MLKKITTSLLVLIIIFSFAGCRTISNDQATKEKIINLGKTEDNVYTNDFFNMTVKIPDKWVVATDEEKMEVIKKGKEVISGDDKSKDEALNLSELRTVYLLMVSEKGLNVQADSNPNFMVLAEKLSFFQGVKNGKDYLIEVRKQYKT